MVLAQKHTHRSKGQNREPKYEPTLLQLINTWQEKQTQWEKDSLFNNGVGNIGQMHAEK